MRALFAVMKREWRGRSLSFDVFFTLAIFGTMLVCSHFMGDALLRGITESGDRTGSLLRRWLITSTLTLGVLLPAAGTLLGAASVYTRQEHSNVEAYLMASISIPAIFLGKFIIGLRPLFSLLILWDAFWIVVQLVCHQSLGVSPVDFMWLSFCLLIAFLSFSAIAAALSGTRYFRNFGQLLTLVYLLLAVTDVLLAEQIISQENNPVQLIQNLLTINPIAVLCRPLHFDLFRTDWLYTHSSVAEFGYRYPTPTMFCILYGFVFLICSVASVLNLKRAFR